LLKIRFFILIISFLLFIVITPLLSQQDDKIIFGKVIDGQSFTPLPYTNISFLNSDVGTSSDINGNFSLTNSVDAKNLVISYVGYKSFIVELNNASYNDENIFSLLPINIFLQEVTVYSNTNKDIKLPEISSLSMQSERIREISVGMPDILRSIQSLPGISVNNEFKAEFNVRGGNQDENLVLVNNTNVYEPYHVKEAANASVGIFNVDLIQKVDLISGGFSARYGDKMSSVLNIQYRDGDKNKFTGAASLSLAYFDGYLEGPITEDFSFILGIRKSYLEYFLKMIDYEDISSAKPSFYDIQGALNYNLSPSNKILFKFIHAGDDFSYEPVKQEISPPISGSFQGEDAEFSASKIENENYKATYFTNLFDVQSINILSSKALLKGDISYYKQTDNEYRLFSRDDNQEIDILTNAEDYYNKIHTERLTYDTLEIKTLELKSDLAYQLTEKYEMNLGLSFQNITYNQNIDDIYTYIRKSNFNDPNIEESDTLITRGELGNKDPIKVESYKHNAYLENIFQVNNDLTFNIGGRVDYFDLNKDLTLSPRISAGYSLTDRTSLRAAWGYYYQSPIYRQLNSSASSDTNTQSQLAIHYIIGLEHSIFFSDVPTDFLKFKVETYYKNYHDLISSWYGTFERLTYSGYNDATGSATGIDIYAALSVPGFYCWLSYGLLFANEDKLADDIGKYPRYTDQRHTLSFISTVDLGADWSFSLKGYYGSGFPYTPKTAVKMNGTWEWKSESINSAYLPSYKRIDVRISKDFIFASSTLNIFVDVSNVFNFKNVQYYEYEIPGFSEPVPEEVLLWPIIPNFGIRYKF
jgi:outer membrane receptor protein involved in Fe transport